MAWENVTLLPDSPGKRSRLWSSGHILLGRNKALGEALPLQLLAPPGPAGPSMKLQGQSDWTYLVLPSSFAFISWHDGVDFSPQLPPLFPPAILPAVWCLIGTWIVSYVLDLILMLHVQLLPQMQQQTLLCLQYHRRMEKLMEQLHLATPSKASWSCEAGQARPYCRA
uniref:Uncharacterized protein n=1 Tax=Sphaerodactylus townsendi TaxID=933632 RepID=A0ACB8EHE6_9SAUR